MRWSHLLANDACKFHGFGSVNPYGSIPVHFSLPNVTSQKHPDANQAGQSKSSQIIQSQRSVTIMSDHAAHNWGLIVVENVTIGPERGVTVTFGSFFSKASALKKCRPKLAERIIKPTKPILWFWKHETPPNGANVPFRPPSSFNDSMDSMKTKQFVGALLDLDECTTFKLGFGVFGSTKGGQSDRQGIERLVKGSMRNSELGDLAISSASSMTPLPFYHRAARPTLTFQEARAS
ncbi:hypothetical protein ARMSODRAFT_968993 [Armillaria solidipes]|uniref:Uncharacterized protein n=1 Tax=Armillaria solidipes TaxID=1076256 RepID=A0A2H3CD07_9AGAR|nr:hypothetical protein ARMSODRAFT_968993 [Armillaria solidipes]